MAGAFEGLSEASGVGPRVTFMGRECTVKARTPQYFSEMQSEILAMRGTPLDSVAEAAERLKDQPDILESFVRQAVTSMRNWKYVTWQDFDDFNRTPRGEAFEIHHALRESLDDFTVDDVERYILDRSVGHGVEAVKERSRVFEAIRIANGDDQGNSESRQGE